MNNKNKSNQITIYIDLERKIVRNIQQKSMSVAIKQYSHQLKKTAKEHTLTAVKFSLVKLRMSMNEEQLNKLFQILAFISKRDTSQLLNNIPSEALPAVLQFTGTKYHCQTLVLENSNKESLSASVLKSIDQITHIRFSNLRTLKISMLGVTSLEPLTFIYAPQLTQLKIYQNNISNLNTLIKTDFPQLQSISFQKNPITSIDKLCRIRSKNLKFFIFDSFATTQRHQVEDYRFLYKMQNIIPQTIALQDPERIYLGNKPYFQKLIKQKTIIIYPRKR